jgi:hypothetical protein
MTNLKLVEITVEQSETFVQSDEDGGEFRSR